MAVAAHAEASTLPARGLPFLIGQAWVQHVRPPPRRTATWPHVYGHAGARDGKRTRVPSAPLRWSGFATRVVAVRPHATRCTTLCRPARGRSRTRCEASAACRQGMGLFGAYESQRSAQLRGALNEGCPRALSSKDATRRKFGSRVQARNLVELLLRNSPLKQEETRNNKTTKQSRQSMSSQSRHNKQAVSRMQGARGYW